MATHGVIGVSVQESSRITLRDNQITGNDQHGIVVNLNANEIVLTNNLIQDNGGAGIWNIGNVAVQVTQNTVSENGTWGILVTNDSRAEIIGNVSERNGEQGITLSFNATATITENVSAQNALAGIVIFGNSTATVTQNTVRTNGTNGIVIDVNSTAEVRGNTVVGNGVVALSAIDVPQDNGILVGGGSVATINGGVIAQNAGPGIYVLASPFNLEPASARIGLDGDAVVEITDNGGAGILVEDDGSEARIDSRSIVFGGNGAGDTVGNVVDVALEP